MKRLLFLVALALVAASPAQAFTKQTGTRTMDDGVGLAYDLYLPSAAAADAPGIVVLHGLGGTKDTVGVIAGYFADHGYAILAYTARGHGTSGGNVELAGPREVADERALLEWFRGLPQVGDKVACWGISYGGGQCWNGVAAGVPFAALAVVETWTDLYSALWPAGVAKSGIVAGFAKTVDARSPLVSSFENDVIHSTNLARVRPLLAERSALSKLNSVKTPVYMFQGKVDWAFDVAQATRAYARLAGPKRLYVGNFGHAPSTFPGPDAEYLFSETLDWYDHFLRGLPNGAGTSRVTIAKPGGGVRSFLAQPRTTSLTLRPGARTTRALETYGGGSVTVTVKKLRAYPRLVAVVFANGKVVTHGGVVPRVGRVTIPLASYVRSIPKRARITLRLAGDSGPSDIAYLGFGDAGSITLGPATIRLSVLR